MTSTTDSSDAALGPAPRPRSRLGHATRDMFRSVRVRNYRLWFIGQLISMTGFFTGMVGQSLLVLDLTDDGSWLGVTVALQFLPALFLSPLAGVLSDRIDKRRLMLATQSAMMCLALILGVLTLTGVVTLAWVLVLALLSGLAWCVDQPARSTIVVELVDREDCANAVSLNAALGQFSKITGPALAGLIGATAGLGWCFMANGITSIAVLLALGLMRPAEIHTAPVVRRQKGQIREGFVYTYRHPQLRIVMSLLPVVALLTLQWNVLLPLFATRDLDGDAGTFGLLMAVMSVGSVSGTLWLARRRTMPIPTLLTSALGLGLAEIALAAAPSTPLACIAITAAGAGVMTTVNGSAVLLQLTAAPAMRGRVMALFSMTTVGLNAAATPAMGAFAERFGARTGLMIGGAAAVVVSSVIRLAPARAQSGRLATNVRTLFRAAPHTE